MPKSERDQSGRKVLSTVDDDVTSPKMKIGTVVQETPVALSGQGDKDDDLFTIIHICDHTYNFEKEQR